MASATTEKDDEKRSMATDAIATTRRDDDDDRNEGGGSPSRPPESRRAADDKGGFFHIYKKGQGYWTRMCTAGAALLIGLLTARFLYRQMPAILGGMGIDQTQTKSITLYIIAALFAGYALLVFWLMNKPANADFLIATDSEMKKVNWTSRKELIGSTKVVIIFMFMIALLLFLFDIIFGYLFYAMNVLHSKPI
jgi:preprotein translocase subunit SecE